MGKTQDLFEDLEQLDDQLEHDLLLAEIDSLGEMLRERQGSGH